MSLSKFTVGEITKIVAEDYECKRRINSWLRISNSGVAGVIRNASIGLVYGLLPSKLDKSFDPSERESMAYRYSCDGIAEATVIAIKGKINTVPELSSVSEQARITGYSHTGTLLEMKDTTKYVLDWWKSLNINSPYVFRYEDFMYQKSGGIPYIEFKGF